MSGLLRVVFLLWKVWAFYPGASSLEMVSGEDPRVQSDRAGGIYQPILNNTLKQSQSETFQKENSPEFIWIGKIFSDGMWNFTPWSHSNEECTKQGEIYRQFLRNGTHWAVQMLDSSVMAPSGLIDGDNMQLGHADQCVYTQVPISGYRTQYCLPTGMFRTKAVELYGRQGDHEWPPYDTSKSIWEFLRDRDPFIRHDRKQFSWGVCVPESCTAKDIEISLQTTLSEAFGSHNITFHVDLSPINCYSAKREEMPLAGKLWVYTFRVLLILMVIGTAVDYNVRKSIQAPEKQLDKKTEDKTSKEDLCKDCEHKMTSEKDLETFKTQSDDIGTIASFFVTFSIIRNFQKLCQDPAEDEISIVGGMRTLVMCFVFVFHRFISSFTYAQNLVFTEHILHNPVYWMLNAATQHLDIFFFLCGFLLTWNYLLLKEQKKRVSPFLFILHRILRIYPTLIAAITFTIYVAPYIVEGPMWKAYGLVEAQKCEKYWWHNLLFISTLFENTDLCILISWFISTDIQLFIISLLIIYVVEKYPSRRTVILTVTFLISHALPSIFIYLKNETSIIMLTTTSNRDFNSHVHLRSIYVKFYMRGAPYMFGLCSAYLFHAMKKTRSLNLSKLQKLLVFLFIIFGNIYSYYFAAQFLEPGVQYNVWHHVILQLVLKLMSGLAAFLVLGIHILDVGNFGAFTDFFCHPISRVLGRLSFHMYMIHTFLLSWDTYGSQSSQYQNIYFLILQICGNFLLTTIVSLITTIMYEYPVAVLRNKILISLAGRQFKKNQ